VIDDNPSTIEKLPSGSLPENVTVCALVLNGEVNTQLIPSQDKLIVFSPTAENIGYPFEKMLVFLKIKPIRIPGDTKGFNSTHIIKSLYQHGQ
jgi:hypothetical protein